MTTTGLLYDPTAPDDAVLAIDGHDYLGADWARDLDPIPAPGHQAGCRLADYGTPAEVCTCAEPL